jgi:hypothetical protein
MLSAYRDLLDIQLGDVRGMYEGTEGSDPCCRPSANPFRVAPDTRISGHSEGPVDGPTDRQTLGVIPLGITLKLSLEV